MFTFFAMILQSLLFFLDKPDELMAIPLILILGGAGAFYLTRNTRDPDTDFQVNIFLWAFSARLWMGMMLYGWGLSNVFGDEDSSGYPIGWSFAKNWYENGFDGFVNNLGQVFFERQNVGQGLIWAIPTFIAGGESRMIVSAVNSFSGAALVIVIFRIAKRVFDSPTARIAAVLVTFWASNILLSASTAKEMLVIFCEWAILYLLIRNPNGLSIKDGLASIPAFLAVFTMRFYALYLLAAAAVFRFLVASPKNLFRNVVFGSVLVASIMIFLGAGGAISRDFERIERLNSQVDSWREGVSQTTGSGIEVYSEYESTSVAIPVATVYFFLAPFPWEAFSGTARNAFGAAENLFIIAILIVGFPAIRIFFGDKFVDMAPIFAFCALYAGMQIWGLSNVGLAWRHKQTVMPLFFMLVAVAITQRKAGWQMITGRINRNRRGLNVIRAN
ncbi:MAG TPA: glycosyltransferase family 39 protein [Pyrinomonadaceae bacterium]|nr:glycosyltransferase family 39 protein [Chloracidobacterium sp.]HRJ88826.1 glycosyltransferase family 39 protein [Pyrinomonadaceae bacterium]HRK48901.1 glycosyltransferase family 39 protein [Pyrinomonadaceae bacterium]